MVPVYKPAARFIRHIRRTGRAMLFTSTSFVGAAALAEELRQEGPEHMEGVVVTQTVPPVDSHASLILTYHKHLSKYRPNEPPNSVSLEGYIAAAILAEGLRRAGDNLTTETLIDALESIHTHEMGLGVKINYDSSEHQAIHKVWGLALRIATGSINGSTWSDLTRLFDTRLARRYHVNTSPLPGMLSCSTPPTC